MKADILRRVEEFSDDDEDAEGQDEFEEDIDGAVGVKVAGDGEESEDDQEEGEEAKPKMLPETICELAYIQDPKLFDRDGQTRRSKARADLKAQTGGQRFRIHLVMTDNNPPFRLVRRTAGGMENHARTRCE